jgi:small nuclear ribonucleoprotein (snRNP)-like protein
VISCTDQGEIKLSVAQRKYFTDVAALTERTVSVITTNGKTFNGTLIGINPDNLSLSLSDVKDDSGKLLNRLVINGSAVLSISTAEKPFDLKSLSQRLDKVFPTMVKLYEDKGFIWVMDKVKLTEKGVVEGSGPAADRVQKVYDAFIAEAKA